MRQRRLTVGWPTACVAAGRGGRAYHVLGVLALLAFELLALKLGGPVRCTMGQVHAEEL